MVFYSAAVVRDLDLRQPHCNLDHSEVRPTTVSYVACRQGCGQTQSWHIEGGQRNS